MVKQIGVDIVDCSRIKVDNTSFLSEKEVKIFQKKAQNQKIPFLAGRFAAKEAIFKAWKDAPKNFKKISILYDEHNKPYVENNAKLLISISHEKTYVVAFCILK